MLPYRKYIINRFKNLQKYLERFQYTLNAEDLHQFRVEFKKIKTFYSVCRHSVPSFKNVKGFKKLKKLYTSSGILRDEDIILDLLQQYNSPAEQNPDELAEKRRKRIQKFYKKTNCHLSSLSSPDKRLLATADKLDLHCLQSYTAEKLRTIRQKMAHPNTEAVLHEIRKEIKHLKYISEFEARCIPAQILRQYDAIQNRIGSWHDKLVLADYLENHYPSNRKPINRLLEESSREAAAIKNKLMTFAT